MTSTHQAAAGTRGKDATCTELRTDTWLRLQNPRQVSYDRTGQLCSHPLVLG
jgi:hypothetical protein